MRFRAGSTLIYPLLLAITVSSGLVLNAGCGGGSSSPKPTPGGSTPTPTPTPTATPTLSETSVRPTIIWSPRSRQVVTDNAVSGPASALSVVLTLSQQSQQGGNTNKFVETFNRSVPISGGPQTYETRTKVLPAVYNLTAVFHAGADGSGAVVGTAAAAVTVNPDGTISTTIATRGTIEQVEVLPGQTVRIGETKDVLYSTRDRDGNVVAVSPGSGFVAIVDATSPEQSTTGQATITASGERITGVNPYQARIKVTVDGTESPVVSVKVLSNVAIDVNPKNATISTGLVGVFTATVTNDGPPASSGVRFTINPVAGTLTQPNATTANLVAGSRDVEGDYQLVATSVYDPNVSVTIPVTVRSLVAVNISPETVPTVSFKGGTQQFAATVAQVPEGRDNGVLWSVIPAEAGTISPSGLFTAGATPGRVTVRATSIFDDRKFDEVSFDVASLAVVRITTPTPIAPISIKTTRALAAAVDNVPAGQDAGVNWSVQGGAANGTIDANGNYTAPATPGDYTVVATSRFDATKTASVVIPVRSFVTVAVPAQPDLSIKDTRTLTATVTGVPEGADAGVTWTIAPATGTPAGTDIGAIDANTGVYRAPANPVSIVVTATSNFDPTKSASRPLAVRSLVVINVTPENATISVNARQQFTAAVTGVATGGDTGVDWRVVTANGGTIDANGLYVAPATPGDYVIEARSKFDPARIRTVTVRVRTGNLGVGVN
ncbi:MAG: hypothetical protein SFU56_21965 [Capsulimonadales bacterium]|nr:hypothetical protein [Capsulimonadales bacterium]